MSEQEKKNAIPTEGTVTETTCKNCEKKAKTKKPLAQRIRENPKAMKWLRRIGIGCGVAASAGVGFLIGRACSMDEDEPEHAEPMKLVQPEELFTDLLLDKNEEMLESAKEGA